ncbi:integrase [Novosphingobium sp. AAP83]|uniref:tyrosine-type recombinase/integrase n=1 Tax=Novosphingobium sp. AAP83 TaxID=1523425 RepID=UPI0006B8D75A|nr:integrase arm-type DNA-binding domain-containing protein [Novosphingobium sp. AAP83]KPF91899.1 integrase [Novosphingobium sp. AAP83]
MLTEMAVKNAKPKDKPYKLSDRNGLHLYVSVTGHKSWRWKHRVDGKETRMQFGVYPETSLAKARELLDEVRAQVRAGVSHSVIKTKAKLGVTSGQGETFETVARAWFQNSVSRWKPVHANDVITSMERDVFPMIGSCPIEQVDQPLMLAVLQKVEDRGAIETAHRLRQRAEAVFNYAAAKAITTNNPAALVRKALKPVLKGKRWPALVEPAAIRSMIRQIDHAGASPISRLASRFLALVAQRPGMVHNAEWTEFTGIDWRDDESDISNALWTVPADKMKQEIEQRQDDRFSHKVPLTPQAVEVLRRVRLLTGSAKYVFCSSRSGQKPMSENCLSYLYKREGFANVHVPHGWRSSFSTIMNAKLERAHPGSAGNLTDRLILDLMLAHTPSGISGNELRYHRAEYMERRRELATIWADLILEDAVELDVILQSPRRRKL